MKRHMKKAKRFILNYWLAISAGSVLEAKAVELAYVKRGYMAYGGEYLVLPLVVMIAYLLNQIIPAVLEEVLYGNYDNGGNCTKDDVHYRRIPSGNRNHRRKRR